GSLALAVSTLAQVHSELDQHLELFEQPFQRISRERLAAPRTDTQETARHLVLSNLTKLSQAEAKARKAALIEALHQARRTGDVDRELELPAQLSARPPRQTQNY